MDIRESTIWTEVERVQRDGSNESVQSWSCEFLIDGVVHKPLRLIDIDFDRQYGKRYSDNIILAVAIPVSMYANYIVPNKDNMTVTLYRNPRTEDGQGLADRPIYAEQFRAMIIGGADPLMQPTGNIPGSDQALDQGNFLTAKFQLIPAAAEQLRLYLVGGIYENHVPGNLLKALFTQYSKTITVDATREIAGVDMVTPDNQNVRKFVTVPDGTTLLELPDILQNRQGGIYNAGIDFYLQTGRWYIWPRYGLNRHNTLMKVLTIYNLPATALPGSERTFLSTDSQVIILATGQSDQQDITETLQLNAGNGVRFADTAQLLGGGVTVKDNKLTARRGATTNEFLTEQRRSGLNLARVSGERISDNPFAQVSDMAAANGYIVTVEWENADPNVLTPGMPTKLFTQRGSELVEKRAILVAAHFAVKPREGKMIATNHVCSGALTFFVAKVDQKRIDLLG